MTLYLCRSGSNGALVRAGSQIAAIEAMGRMDAARYENEEDWTYYAVGWRAVDVESLSLTEGVIATWWSTGGWESLSLRSL